ncbi:hypothetical protein ACFYVL_40390 [Streptomyces sp. NPDC004111]|uniref:hypothetical protein n=1 Tax=Streptomyces sp. NPDC004111 TaxID=3364690 RepID=UPI0036A97798
MQRRIYETAADRAQGDPRLLQYTPEEEAADEYAGAGRPWPEGPIAMLPVAQLYRRDVPLLNPPGPADLLQVLWCPFDHPAHPRTAVFWRTAASITDALTAPPEPPAIQFPGYLPQPCVLAPEHVTEYPNDLELSQELRQQLEDCDVWRAAAADADETPGGFYSEELSVSPGWKLGGWTRWGLTDPQPRQCEVCGTELNPLLTIATREWVGATSTWIPHEDQAAPASPLDPYPAEPTKVQVADAYDLQLYVCPVSPDHPHLDLVQ